MKKYTLLFLPLLFFIFLQSCQKECCEHGEPIPQQPRFVDGRGTATVQGLINCINNMPKEGVLVEIQDSSGTQWSQLTDSLGIFEFAQMPNVQYTIAFSYSDNDTTAYTPTEIDSIEAQMANYLTTTSARELIAAYLYDVNASGSITPSDLIEFRKAYEAQQYHLPWKWRFVSLDESTQIASNAFTYPSNLSINMYTPNASIDLEYIVGRVGDRYGYACDN